MQFLKKKIGSEGPIGFRTSFFLFFGFPKLKSQTQCRISLRYNVRSTNSLHVITIEFELHREILAQKLE
ncbi:hypothetical protein L6452_00261 [Arctium lappa]|uniref:Uncharacterized protein n=1 Tax=Arctium lappa TaxID=4217 RepID=A0ACB9FDU5_ARCLA|nr:hypothetical protein L6452_00261 [Arctium lappa]